jgi:NAD(P)-dependent dehydrogenase (short-subunit alcohol dehydrogenase family)
LTLAAAGSHVIAVDCEQISLNKLISDSTENIEVWHCDVTDDTFYRRIEQLEQLDILFNNVGMNKSQAFVDVDHETRDQILSLNIRSIFLTAQCAARVMIQNGNGGSISTHHLKWVMSVYLDEACIAHPNMPLKD